MNKFLISRVAPVALAVGALGAVASPSFAATHAPKSPAKHVTANHAKKTTAKKTTAKKTAAKKAAGTFALRGKVVSVDAKTGRLSLEVGKKDLVVAFGKSTDFTRGAKKVDDLALKSGETVAAHGQIVKHIRTASSVAIS